MAIPGLKNGPLHGAQNFFQSEIRLAKRFSWERFLIWFMWRCRFEILNSLIFIEIHTNGKLPSIGKNLILVSKRSNISPWLVPVVLLSATSPLPSGVWPWLTGGNPGGNPFDNEWIDGLSCPYLKKNSFFGLMREKSSIGKGSQAFRYRSIPVQLVKSGSIRLETWKSRALTHNSSKL